MDRTLNSEEITELLDEWGEQKVRLCQSALLLPFNQIYSMLNISFRSAWEAGRQLQKGLPTTKTALKHLAQASEPVSLRARERFMRSIPMRRTVVELMHYQFEQGYSSPEAVQWLSFLEGAQVTPAMLEHWRSKLFAVSILSFKCSRISCIRERLVAYNASDVVVRLGCPLGRELLSNLLACSEDDQELQDSTAMVQILLADSVSNLLRLAAWLAAESQVAGWDSLGQAEQNSMIAVWGLPEWSQNTGKWSNTFPIGLAKLARSAGLSTPGGVRIFV